MGLLALLLCCGLDAKDDTDDKYQRQPATRVTTSQSRQTAKSKIAAATTPPRSASPQPAPTPLTAKKPKKDLSKKDLLDDDNSVNETDTITNTNEECTPMPNTAANSNGGGTQGTSGNSGRERAASGSAAGASGVGALGHESLLPEHDEVFDPSGLSDPPERSDRSDRSGRSDKSDDMGDDELFDLTKIQEGQAFNADTGFLLGKKDKKYGSKKCLILDLDETLVHSSFKYLRTADFVIPVEIDNQVHHVYVIKRPGVDEFLEKVGQWFEVVVFTASVAKYGDPLLNKLDVHQLVHHRLFRDLCYNYQGNFIKNLSQIGRPLRDSIIIDNSPASYIFHPQHSIPISSWFSDTHDNELLDLLPFLEDISKPNVDDVGLVLDITI